MVRTWPRSIAWLIIGLAAVALGTGVRCGDDDEKPDLEVRLSEFKIVLDRSSIAAGDVEILARNDGRETHELIVVRTDLAPNQLPIAPSENRVDETRLGVLGGETIGEIEDVEKGKKQTQTFELTPGKYVLFCNLPVHYQQGMHAALTVE